MATISLSVILCVSLHRLHKLEELSTDVLCDKKIINRHQRAFIAAAGIGLLSYSLSYAPDDNFKLHSIKNIIDIASLLSWNVVQFLILTVFVRFGRPLVDDDETLLATKFQEIIAKKEEEDTDERARFER